MAPPGSPLAPGAMHAHPRLTSLAGLRAGLAGHGAGRMRGILAGCGKCTPGFAHPPCLLAAVREAFRCLVRDMVGI